MAEPPEDREGNINALAASELGIPRVISMPVVPSAEVKTKPMPLPMVSRNPSIAQINQGSVASKKTGIIVASTNFQCAAKATRPASNEGECAASGRWTSAEHEAFLAGLKVYGREWKKVAQCIPTRTPAQIRSHAQKYFNKVSKEQQDVMAAEPRRILSCPASLTLKSETPLKNVDTTPMSTSYHEFVKAISEDPASAESKVSSALQNLHAQKAELESQIRRIKPAEKMPKACTAEFKTSTDLSSLGPASAALKAEQKTLRKAAVARYEMKRNSRTPSPKESFSHLSGKRCASVSLASMPGEFDSGEVLALSLLGGSFKRENIHDNLRQPHTKSRKTDH